MKLYFNKKRQLLHLILGLLFLGLGLASAIFEEGSTLNYFNIIIGAIYLIHYCYNHFKGFGLLENNKLRVNGWKSKTLDLENLTEVRHFAGDLILKTNTSYVNIANNALTPASRELIENNPFVKNFNS